MRLTIGSALLFPATLLAFLRPVPLPYSWAAPAEPLSHYAAVESAVMIVALILFHGGTLLETWRNERLRRSIREMDAAHDVRERDTDQQDIDSILAPISESSIL